MLELPTRRFEQFLNTKVHLTVSHFFPVQFCLVLRVQLSEAVVGGLLPGRVPQQAVRGVFAQFAVSRNSCELGTQGKAVAVKTVGGRSVREMRQEGRTRGAQRAVQGDEARGAPGGPVQTWIPAVKGLLPLQRRQKWQVR